MALRPTVYKFGINLSDLDRNVFETLNLTVAQHPSETAERMMVRVLAYCLNAEPQLEFTNGLNEPDLPDLTARTLDGQQRLWLDVGEPAFERIKRASRVAQSVKIYSFNSKSGVWWQQQGPSLAALPIDVVQIPWAHAQAMAALVTRTMDWSVSIADGSAYIASPTGQCEVHWTYLHTTEPTARRGR